MFRIGTLVKNSKLGPAIQGDVVGNARPGRYSPDENMVNWDPLYPDWRLGVVYFVRLSRPAKGVREDECIADGLKYKKVPLFVQLAYPEADLEAICE